MICVQDKRRDLILLIMAFLIILFYEVLRPIKTSLVVTAEGSSTLIIPYLRTWVVLPCSLLMAGVLSKLSKHFQKSQIFVIILSFFLVFFLVFITLLYPYRKNFELEHFTKFLSSNSILETKGLLLIIKYWHFSFFFVFCELWAPIVLSILFWGYVNETTSIDDAKKLYALLLLIGNSSVIFSGLFGQFFVSPVFHNFVPFGYDSWDKTVYSTLIFALMSGVFILFSFKYLDHMVNRQPLTEEPKVIINIKDVFKSGHLLCITFIVVAYNISYHLIEILWTSKLHQACPDPTQMSASISQVIFLTGVFSIFFAFFVCKKVLQQFGWTITALITPFIWLITGIVFFLGIFFKDITVCQIFISFLNLTPLSFIVLLGAIQLSLGKASKYTFFDQTKEISFIPLSVKEQRIGKIWVEGIVIWVGKFGGDFIYQLLSIFYFEENLALSILCIFLVFVLVWVISVKILGNKIEDYS